MNSKKNPYALLIIDPKSAGALTTGELQKKVDHGVRVVYNLTKSEDPEIAKVANEAIVAYANGQRDLFRSKGLNPDRSLKEAMVVAERDGKPVFRIIPRDAVLGEVKFDDDAVSDRVAAVPSVSKRMGFEKEGRRGKYNDGAMLINGEAANIDRAEYVPICSMD